MLTPFVMIQILGLVVNYLIDSIKWLTLNIKWVINDCE